MNRIILLAMTFILPLTTFGTSYGMPKLGSDPRFFFNKPSLSSGSSQTIDRFENAYETVQSQPEIQRILRNPSHTLAAKKKILNNGLETTKFQHLYKGIEVVGSLASKHVGPSGVNVSNHISEFDIDTRPSVNTESAVSLARSYVSSDAVIEKPVIKIWPKSITSSLTPGSAQLIYQISIGSNLSAEDQDLIIDAHTGQLIGEVPHQIEIAQVNILSTTGNTLTLPDQLPEDPKKWPQELKQKVRSSCQSIDQEGRPILIFLDKCKSATEQNDVVIQNAKKNASLVLDYYSKNFQRNSFDNRGSNLNSLVHVGNRFSNAFWHSQLNFMAYGDGDGKIYNNFTAALDVAGHEMTHGMIGNETDGPQLIPMAEPGALNEAYADFFGKMVENENNWVIGHTITVDPSKKAGFRDLAHPESINAVLPPPQRGAPPTVIPYPSHMQEILPVDTKCTRDNDFCWVHINATIPGHASYLVTQAIGKEKAQKLYYATLTHYLRETSTIQEAADATLQACSQMYDQNICQSVKTAFEQVGL